MKKILRVFRERNIYSVPKVDKLHAVVRSSLTGTRLVEFNMELGTAVSKVESNSRQRLTPTTPPQIISGTKRAHPTNDSPQPSSSASSESSFEKKVWSQFCLCS